MKMKVKSSFIVATLCVLCVLSISLESISISIVGSASSSPTTNQFLGISPQNEKCYKSSKMIKCKDGSKKFSRAQLNDNFCDCPDGTTGLVHLHAQLENFIVRMWDKLFS
ncbi:hypothetical protein ACFX15_012925 [Malus domestica]